MTKAQYIKATPVINEINRLEGLRNGVNDRKLDVKIGDTTVNQFLLSPEAEKNIRDAIANEIGKKIIRLEDELSKI